jgi:hypothetical protein
MKSLYFLLLLLTGFAGFAFSPPVINQPPNMESCSGSVVNLNNQTPIILGALNPGLYNVSFHYSMTDAETGANPIVNSTAYPTIGSEMIFVRVEDIANPADYALTAFQIVASPIVIGTITTASGTVCGDATVTFVALGGISPFMFTYITNGGVQQTIMAGVENYATIILPAGGIYDIQLVAVQSAFGPPFCGQLDSNNLVHIETLPVLVVGTPTDLTIEQIPFVGTANFDFTFNDALLLNGDPNLTISYHHSEIDAQVGGNPIPNPSAYSGTNGETIWAGVTSNVSGCRVIKDFQLYITNPDIVFIPDANFKNILVISDGANQAAQDLAHNFTLVDANGDGEIQYSEAANISLLNIAQRGIADLTGLEAFPNLNWLNVGYNADLTSIPTATLPLLTQLTATHCNLNILDLSNNPDLLTISLEYNNLTSLDFSSNPLVTFIHCQNNHLTNLNLTGLTLLNNLWASDNNLTSVNTADLDSIIYFNVAGNVITALDLTAMTTVQELLIERNQIDSIDTAGCTALTNLRCANNQMTYLEVSESTALNNLDCGINTLVNLDLGANNALCSLNAGWNNTLVTINIKNGVDACYTNFYLYGTANVLQQFCCDDNEVSYFKAYYLNQFYDVNVSSYCTFTPGGDYNTITASMQFDAGGNGCDVNDSGFANVRLNIDDSTNQGAAFTDTNGFGFFFTQAGTFTVTPAVENPTWFTISPSSVVIPFANTNNNTVNQNFCIAPNGIHPDLEIVVAPLTSARPGFDAYYKIVVRNKGNQTMTQFNNGISFSYDSARMNLIDSSLPVSNSTAGTLNWDLVELAAFESRSITLRMHVNPPTHPTAPVNIGDLFTFNVIANPIVGDEIPADNTFHLQQTVIGSYDPNEIVCLEGNIVSPVEIGNYLHYAINFENTGTADAENIVVRDVIDTTQFDVSSLQLLDSSASVTTRLVGNVAEFIFPGINLHSGGHGNILIKVRSNNTLVSGDTVSKTANIFFDYNFPVATLPENTLFQSLNNPDVPVDASISVYPNPTKGTVNINCSNTIKSVQLYDIQGRLLQTSLINETSTSIDISNQANGVYFLKVMSDDGMKVQKIVRE